MRLYDLLDIAEDDRWNYKNLDYDLFCKYVKSCESFDVFWSNCNRADWMLFVHRNIVPYTNNVYFNMCEVIMHLSSIGWYVLYDYSLTLLVDSKKHKDVQKKGADICRKYLSDDIKKLF